MELAAILCFIGMKVYSISSTHPRLLIETSSYLNKDNFSSSIPLFCNFVGFGSLSVIRTTKNNDYT